MTWLLPLAVFLVLACSAWGRKDLDSEEELRPEESRRRIYDMVREHEGRQHGGHEYEEGEVPLKQLASRKRYGYLPLHSDSKTPVYYEEPPKKVYEPAPKPYETKIYDSDHKKSKPYGYHLPKDNVYRENVAAYAEKPLPLANSQYHQVLSSPVSHSHFTLGHPKTKYLTYEKPKPKAHYLVYEDPKSHKQPIVVDPSSHQYVVYEPRPYKQSLAVDPSHHGTYILEEDPHHPVEVVEPHYHVPSKHHSEHQHGHHDVLEKGHHDSGHGYHSDKGQHGESGHKAHKKYEVAGHKAHSSSGGHKDEHDREHDKAHYERDRGYHYEKAYAYDHVRASHDIGHDKKQHSDHHAHHGNQAHKQSGDEGSSAYNYFKKHDGSGDHGYGKKSYYKKDHGDHGYYHQGQHASLPHNHAYGK